VHKCPKYNKSQLITRLNANRPQSTVYNLHYSCHKCDSHSLALLEGCQQIFTYVDKHGESNGHVQNCLAFVSRFAKVTALLCGDTDLHPRHFGGRYTSYSAFAKRQSSLLFQSIESTVRLYVILSVVEGSNSDSSYTFRVTFYREQDCE